MKRIIAWEFVVQVKPETFAPGERVVLKLNKTSSEIGWGRAVPEVCRIFRGGELANQDTSRVIAKLIGVPRDEGEMTMALPTVPDWLKLREGQLKSGLREHIVLVILGNQPQYKLEIRPASGVYSCYVTQTVNGKRLDAGTTYPSVDSAFAGGLDELRASLGW